MHRVSVLLTATLVTTAAVSGAQGFAAVGIPNTIASAEAEGVSFPRRPDPSVASVFFKGQFGGTSERKCVTVSSGGTTPGGSLRSGDFILRSSLLWGDTPRANRPYKILWVPLHNPWENPNALLIRVARLGRDEDWFRRAIGEWAYPASKVDSGFPSLVSFPAVGDWLIVATIGDDWGCFRVTVAS